jgi:hypothetical protein
MFGRQKLALPANTKIVFRNRGASAGQGHPYEELFYRQSDVIAMQAHTVELVTVDMTCWCGSRRNGCESATKS